MTDTNNVDYHFLTEAGELLQTIEETLINLLDEKTVDRVHSLMRSAHTLKGSAAYLELETIETIAHELETVFESLYPEELELDPELNALLLDAYECLRTPLNAILSESDYDEEQVKSYAETVFSQLKEKLGDYYNNPAPPPSSEELGFDVLGSIIENSLPQDLENIEKAIQNSDTTNARELCQSQAEFLLELATSYELSGLENIARAVLTALKLYPDQTLDIAQAALTNFQEAKNAIANGDRAEGGTLNPQLQQWTQEQEKTQESAIILSETSVEPPPISLDFYESDLPPATVSRSTNPIDQILESIWSGDAEQNFKQADTASESTPPPPPKAKPTDQDQTTIRVALTRLNRLNYAIGELAIAQNQQSLQSDRAHKLSRQSRQQLRQIREQLDDIRDEVDVSSRQRQQQARKHRQTTPSSLVTQSSFDELEMDSYSSLHLMLQSLGEQINDLEDNLDDLDNFLGQSRIKIRQEKQLLSTAQDELLQARMVPLETVLNRFPPMVEQLAKTYNKPVDLNITGKDVLVDKAILEKLYDPLLHLVRNTFAHGIESSEVRQEKGKPPTGKITLSAYRQGNRTLVEIADDGKGIDWEKIRETAAKKQFFLDSDADLSELLFTPGFSTSEQANELSGRGTGLDVVRNQIHGVGGTVSLTSQRDRGTTFTLQLPLNIATARLLICEAGGRFYSLLAQKVHRMLLPKPEQVENQLLQWEEGGEPQLLPILPLNQVIHQEETFSFPQNNIPLTPFPLEPKNTVNPLLLIQTRGELLCLQVDRILVEQELVIKTLPSGPPLPDYVQGYTVLADGSLSLVVDPEAIMTETVEAQTVTHAPVKQLSPVTAETTETPPAKETKHSTVLVVEDSIVQRRSMVETLETGGYPVLQAGDGKSAIALLHKHPEVNLILCDIEMPQMNGFEFLGYCRQREELSQIPVIMLTSRSGEKHRNLASQLGAKAYLTKPCSDRALLETVANYES
ncbi:CheA signal transduction histidine kinase [Halothece sp. PCC 7418]|uniref:hybrid sensor histidine kinase/response regulator n=1 Tax=Halothece sp. (strain PCC 7418) TaxID=65093 RepID=UPI0002A06C3B|nr:response regulator [Halothece sp. PCC 7418]AFZ44006.1 CheA signal transduction histidine kinase [Halothece sp. PCC 7418]